VGTGEAGAWPPRQDEGRLMGELKVRVYVRAQGPLFDGAAPEIIHAWMDEVKKDIAQEGVNRLRAFVMNKTGRATGHYQSEIQTSTLVAFNDIRIFDPVVYGPWLEGTSKRNRSTRFKGYRLWRKTAQALNDDATAIADRRMPELVQKLGGG
jgi:hypothetical protein